jgi:hypothetical protein
MIKPEDLRIGDFVKISSDHSTIPQGTICKVVGIDDALSFPDNFNGCVSLLELDREKGDTPTGMWCEEIEGIPITKEFLIKNGFKEFRHRVEEEGYEWYIYENEINCTEVRYYPISKKYLVSYDGIVLYEIFFVHELQNFIYTLKEDIEITI